MAIGPHLLSATVEAMGDRYHYKTFDRGTVELSQAGECLVTVRPASGSDHKLMCFQSLKLEPAELI
ncbi:MAG: hypothetical protein MUQ25_12805 [Candidatus Aminicenantes bacterium]|nr:hypothetical protein [Candidatus Aminicenantes bacterium]